MTREKLECTEMKKHPGTDKKKTWWGFTFTLGDMKLTIPADKKDAYHMGDEILVDFTIYDKPRASTLADFESK